MWRPRRLTRSRGAARGCGRCVSSRASSTSRWSILGRGALTAAEHAGEISQPEIRRDVVRYAGGFSVVARTNAAVHGAIHAIHVEADDAWTPALGANGQPRDDAFVTELTDTVDLSGWPPGTRLIVRREPRHPGAQQSLFASELWRYWGHYTDQTGDPTVLDADMRAHANAAWLALVCWAADLVRWFQLLCLTGPLARANPKALRWRVFHAPARAVRRGGRLILRLLDDWPDTPALLAADQRIHQLA